MAQTVAPRYFAYCQQCRKNTLHGGATDDHGCERGGQCHVCDFIQVPRPCAFETRPTAQKKSA